MFQFIELKYDWSKAFHRPYNRSNDGTKNMRTKTKNEDQSATNAFLLSQFVQCDVKYAPHADFLVNVIFQQHKTIKLILFTCVWLDLHTENYELNQIFFSIGDINTHSKRTCYENDDDTPTSNPIESESCFLNEIFFHVFFYYYREQLFDFDCF